MTPSGDALRRRAPVATALVVLAAALLVLTPQPAGVFWDDGVYLITARALATGEGYRFIHLPGAPPAVHFPPAWPALLAFVWRAAPAFPDNLRWFRLVNPVQLAVAAGLTCRFAIREVRLPPAVAAAGATLFALTLPVLILAGVLFAEPLFLCTLLGALMIGTAAVEGGGARRAAMAGAAAALAALVRSTGLVLLPAMLVALVLRRRTREAWIAAVTGLACVLPWQLWSSAAAAQLSPPLRGNYGPYLAWFVDGVRDRGLPFVGAIARQNLVALQRAAAVVFFPIGVREVRPLLVVLLAVVASLGLMMVWRRASAAVLFLAAYAVLVVVWPYAPDRFAWGVWPLVGVVIAAGAWRAWEHVVRPGAPAGERGAAGVLVGVALLAGAGAAFYTGRGISRGWADVAQRRNAARLAPVVDWVRAHTPPAAVVAVDGDPLVALYTQRTVVPVQILSPDEYLGGSPPARAAEDLRALVDAGGADFAVLSGGAGLQDAARLLTTGSPRLVAVDTLPGGGMAFRVVREPIR